MGQLRAHRRTNVVRTSTAAGVSRHTYLHGESKLIGDEEGESGIRYVAWTDI